MANRTEAIRMTLSELQDNLSQQDFSNVIFRAVVQQWTKLQLTVRRAVPFAIAELLVRVHYVELNINSLRNNCY